MFCPKCDNSPLRITHTYVTENNYKVCSARCGLCLGRFTIAGMIVGQATARGEGAEALKKDLETGEKVLKLEQKA